MRQWAAEGRVNAETQVLAEGASEWRPLGTYPELTHLSTTPQGAPSVFPGSVPARRAHPMATPALVMGILSLLLWCCCHGVPFNILGIIFAVIALSAIRKQPEVYDGRGMAIAGLVMSILSLVFLAFMLIFGVASSLPDMLRELQNM
jgi:hypothetical protein